MQDLILIPFSKHEFKAMIKDCINEVLSEHKPGSMNAEIDKPMSITEASEFLNLATQTIYGLTSKNQIPHNKKGKKLYFSKSELIVWLNEGKRKTISEIEQEAENYISQNEN